MGLGQAEQHCTFCVHVFSCVYSTVQLPGASLASVEVYIDTFFVDISALSSFDGWSNTQAMSEKLI